MTSDPKEPNGDHQGFALAVAILTITAVVAAFWVIAWLILDHFNA